MGPEQERVIRLIVDVGEGAPRGGLRLLKSRSAGFSMRQRFAMQAWTLVWLFLFRPTPPPFHPWRRLLLRCFGAQIATGAHVDAGTRILAPWNLVAGR
jgi:hypothetical protein